MTRLADIIVDEGMLDHAALDYILPRQKDQEQGGNEQPGTVAPE